MSDDKSKGCIANQCSCPNGVGSYGAKCSSDGDSKCESCNAGFKLASDSKSCEGMLARLHVMIVKAYVARQFVYLTGFASVVSM